MVSIGARLRKLREQKGYSQGDIEKATGLLRCYTSRVENGHTVPSLETLERFAKALGLPLYQLFYEGDTPPAAADASARETLEGLAALPGKQGADAKFLLRLKGHLDHLAERDREMIVSLAKKLASH